MSNIISYGAVESKILEIRGQYVILDSHIAELYGVATKHINQAVRNNADKFPDGYLIELTEAEWLPLRSKILTAIKGGRTSLPKAFTERGLYMLATILKSPKATGTTLSIIDTFAQLRQVNRSIVEIIKDPENEPKQKSLLNKAGAMISRLIMPSEDDLEVIETETTYKLNLLASLEFTKKTKKAKKKIK